MASLVCLGLLQSHLIRMMNITRPPQQARCHRHPWLVACTPLLDRDGGSPQPVSSLRVVVFLPRYAWRIRLGQAVEKTMTKQKKQRHTLLNIPPSCSLEDHGLTYTRRATLNPFGIPMRSLKKSLGVKYFLGSLNHQQTHRNDGHHPTLLHGETVITRPPQTHTLHHRLPPPTPTPRLPLSLLVWWNVRDLP